MLRAIETALFLALSALPARAFADAAAELVAVAGDVRVDHGTMSSRGAARGGSPLAVGDVIVTGPRSTASVRLADGSLLVVGERSRLVLSRVVVDVAASRRDVSLLLEMGEVLARIARMLALVEIRTPTDAVRSREAELLVRVEEDGRTTVEVTSGAVERDRASTEPATAAPASRPAATAPRAVQSVATRPGEHAATPGHTSPLTRATDAVLSDATLERTLREVGDRALGQLTPAIDRLVPALSPALSLPTPVAPLLGRRTGGGSVRGTVEFR